MRWSAWSWTEIIKVGNARRLEVFVERFDAWPVLCYELESMASRIALSLLLAMTIVLAPARLSARPCVLSNVPSEKACEISCCANKTCCATSPKNTSAPLQPLAKANSSHELNATCVAMVTAVPPSQQLGVQSFLSSSAPGAHSPPPLALICIRLI